MTSCGGTDAVVATTICNHCATRDVEVVAFSCIESTFRTSTTEGQYYATADIHVAVGVDAVVRRCLSKYITAFDVHVAGRVDGIVGTRHADEFAVVDR